MNTRPISSRIEILEPRIAPATLLSPTTVTYHDTDGDDVTIKLSKPLFDAATINDVLHFDTGAANGTKTNPDPARQQLRLLDLTALGVPADATGISVTITAKTNPQLGGDGLAKVGYVKATRIDLGAVTVDGDLGRIFAGNGSATKPALNSLTVDSLGVAGLTTQEGGGGLQSVIFGKLGSLSVKHDMVGAFFSTTGVLGTVKIGGDLRGTTASGSGQISAGASMGSVTILGSVVGVGDLSGYIHSVGPMGAVKITGDLEGGTGSNSGEIASDSTIASISIGGEMHGSSGPQSATIQVLGNLGKVTIGGTLVSGAGPNSGKIITLGKLAGLRIGGSLIGTSDQRAASGDGQVFSQGDMGPVSVFGDVVAANSGNFAGTIQTKGNLAGVVIGGELRGGPGPDSGSILAVGDIGPVKIGRDIQGGPSGGNNSGIVYSTAGSIAKVTVGGSLNGGDEIGAGQIVAAKNLGPVTIGGDVKGGTVGFTARIATLAGDIVSVTIGGSLLGGTDNRFIPSGYTGCIVSSGEIGAVKIAGEMTGKLGKWTGTITGDRILSVTVGGSISGDTAYGFSGSIVATHDIGSIVVKGSILGGSNPYPVIIAAGGSLTPTATGDLAIKSISVVGNVSGVSIRGGVIDHSGRTLTDVNAQIGSVTVGGNWSSSSLSSGAQSGGFEVGRQGDTFPGTFSQIAKIVIKGTVSGDANHTIDSGKIVSMTVGGIKQPLTNGADSFTVAGGTLQVFDGR